MKALVLRDEDNNNFFNNLMDLFVLTINWFDLRHQFYKSSRSIKFFDVRFTDSLEARLISVAFYFRLKRITKSKNIVLPDKFFKSKYKTRILFIDIVINNQKYIKYSDKEFLKIIESDNFKELINLSLNFFIDGSASVEWVLKELGCDYKIEDVIDQSKEKNDLLNEDNKGAITAVIDSYNKFGSKIDEKIEIPESLKINRNAYMEYEFFRHKLNIDGTVDFEKITKNEGIDFLNEKYKINFNGFKSYNNVLVKLSREKDVLKTNSQIGYATTCTKQAKDIAKFLNDQKVIPSLKEKILRLHEKKDTEYN